MWNSPSSRRFQHSTFKTDRPIWLAECLGRAEAHNRHSRRSPANSFLFFLAEHMSDHGCPSAVIDFAVVGWVHENLFELNCAEYGDCR